MTLLILLTILWLQHLVQIDPKLLCLFLDFLGDIVFENLVDLLGHVLVQLLYLVSGFVSYATKIAQALQNRLRILQNAGNIRIDTRLRKLALDDNGNGNTIGVNETTLTP